MFILYLKAKLTPPPLIIGQVVTERHISLLLSCKLENGHYESLLPGEAEEKFGIFD
jgi:hypothetical protein